MTLVMTHVDSTINIVLVIIIKLNHNFWRIPLSAGLTELRMCLLLLALKQEMDKFFTRYTSKLEEKEIDEFTDEEKREVLSALKIGAFMALKISTKFCFMVFSECFCSKN